MQLRTFTPITPCTAFVECQSGVGETLEADACWDQIELRVGLGNVSLSAEDAAELGMWLLLHSQRIYWQNKPAGAD